MYGDHGGEKREISVQVLPPSPRRRASERAVGEVDDAVFSAQVDDPVALVLAFVQRVDVLHSHKGDDFEDALDLSDVGVTHTHVTDSPIVHFGLNRPIDLL